MVPVDSNIVKNQRSEIHVFSFYGDYVLGNHDAKYSIFESTTNSLLVDVATTFREANINRGSYLLAINYFQDVLGDFDNKSVFIREISPDRTELKLSIDKNFTSQINGLKQNNILNNLVVNFGFNRIEKIINVRFDAVEEGTFYVKLYQPLYDELEN